MKPVQTLSRQLLTSLAVIGMVVVVAVGVILYSKKDGSGVAADPSTGLTTVTSQSTVPTNSKSGSYKDGTYAANGSYRTPESNESIKVTLTIKNNVVTAANVTGSPSARESRQYQQDFIAGYKSFVVGKNVDSIALDAVSGASLTSQGFNSALELIKSQAQT